MSLSTTGCSQFNGSSNSSSDDITVTKAPDEYKQKAINTDGTLTVRGMITTKGPLSSISSTNINNSGNDIDGIFYALNNTQRSVSAEEFVESVDIDKIFDNGLILTKNGDILEVRSGEGLISTESYPFTFNDNIWTINSAFSQTTPILSETDLIIDTSELLITYPIYSYENITFNKDIIVDVGSPFENAIVAKGNINFQKSDIIGRVHSGGKITTTDNLKLIGTIESKEDIVINGNLDVNYLDLVYKAAKIASYEHFETPRLVYSKLFKTLNDENGVAVFIYVDKYLVDEEKLKEIIEEGKESDYKFLSLIVGASKDDIGVKERIEGLLPLYKNKLEIETKLKRLGYDNFKVTENLAIDNKELFLTYSSDKQKIGTYRVFGALVGETDEENLIVLSDDSRNTMFENLAENSSIVENEKEEVLQHAQTLSKKNSLKDSIETYHKEVENYNPEDNSTKEVFTKYSDSDLSVFGEHGRYSYWNNISSSKEMPEATFNTEESSSQNLRSFRKYGTTGYTWYYGQYRMSLIQGYWDWNSNFSITDTITQRWIGGNRLYLDEHTAIISTAMILKYADYSYYLNSKFDYSNNNLYRRNAYNYGSYTLKSGIDSTLKTRLKDIENSFRSSRILIDSFYKSVNAGGLTSGISKHLNNNSIYNIRAEQIRNHYSSNIFAKEAEYVVKDLGQPLILTVDQRRFTNGGHRYLNKVILGTYKHWYGYKPVSYLRVYDPTYNYISWNYLYDGDSSYYKYITFLVKR